MIKVAADGRLKQPEVLEAQARRMLADSRALSLVRNFALKWLNVDNLSEVQPDPLLFPSFNDQLRRDMAVEIESFVASVLLQDRNVNDLLTANHTFVNEQLARHYGITSVLGPQFRRVEFKILSAGGYWAKARFFFGPLTPTARHRCFAARG